MIPFAATKAQRLPAGDPRPSIEERYPNHGAYVSAVSHGVNDLVQRRLLLDADAEAFKDAASASSIAGSKVLQRTRGAYRLVRARVIKSGPQDSQAVKSVLQYAAFARRSKWQ